MSSFYDSVVNVLYKRDPSVSQKFQSSYNPQGEQRDSISNLNRYLRTQLGQLPVSTIAERECLMDNVSEKEWLRLFTKHVAPTVVAYGLPDWK